MCPACTGTRKVHYNTVQLSVRYLSIIVVTTANTACSLIVHRAWRVDLNSAASINARRTPQPFLRTRSGYGVRMGTSLVTHSASISCQDSDALPGALP